MPADDDDDFIVGAGPFMHDQNIEPIFDWSACRLGDLISLRLIAIFFRLGPSTEKVSGACFLPRCASCQKWSSENGGDIITFGHQVLLYDVKCLKFNQVWRVFSEPRSDWSDSGLQARETP